MNGIPLAGRQNHLSRFGSTPPGAPAGRHGLSGTDVPGDGVGVSYASPADLRYQSRRGDCGLARRGRGEPDVLHPDHWGYAFYPSHSAVPHPNLKLDLFGTECALARKAGISVLAYYSLQFNNQCAISHPDWAWTNEEGSSEQRFYGKWHVMCLDSPYRQYVLAMMDEIFSRYEVDELFLDIFGIQFAMYSAQRRSVLSAFAVTPRKRGPGIIPGDPYREGFNTHEGWERRFQWHQRRTMIDMLDEIIAIGPQAPAQTSGFTQRRPGIISRRDHAASELHLCRAARMPYWYRAGVDTHAWMGSPRLSGRGLHGVRVLRCVPG